MHFCRPVRVSLVIEMWSTQDLGTRWRGAFGPFMIIRPTLVAAIGVNLFTQNAAMTSF